MFYFRLMSLKGVVSVLLDALSFVIKAQKLNEVNEQYLSS